MKPFFHSTHCLGLNYLKISDIIENNIKMETVMKSKLAYAAFSLLTVIGTPSFAIDVPPAAIAEETATPLEDWILETDVVLQKLTHNNAAVMRQYDAFATALKKSQKLTSQDKSAILIALKFAADKHQFQTRKDPEKTPYIIHPIGVAYQLLTVAKEENADVLIAALLHDTVEDTKTSFEEIGETFGPNVEKVVRELTDDKALPKQERKRLQIVNAPHKSGPAALIKLSDKLYNLSDLANNPPTVWNASEVDQYFRWAQYVISGLPKVNAPLKEAIDTLIAQRFAEQPETE
jgi:hypothetical protein